MFCCVTLMMAMFALVTSKPTTPSRKPGVDLTSTSQFITEGFTKSLVLNCSHAHDLASSDVTASLVLAKTDSVDGTSYTNIAALNFASPDHVTVNDDLGAKVTGKLKAAGTSYISYQWKYPGHTVEGMYRCTVHILPRIGHPVTATATTNIGQKSVNIQEVLDKLKEMDIRQEAITEELHNTTAQLYKTREQNKQAVSQLTNNLESVSTDVEENQNKLTSLMSDYNPLNQSLDTYLKKLFIAQTTYKGHTYELSRRVYNDVFRFNSICQLKGGYLVELNDQAEYNHVKSFYSANNKKPQINTMLGMSDYGHQQSWTYFHSGGPVTFTKWNSGQPTATDGHDCVYLHNSNLNMYAYPCVNTMHARIMCEIPS